MDAGRFLKHRSQDQPSATFNLSDFSLLLSILRSSKCHPYEMARKVKESVEACEKMEKLGFKPDCSDFNRLIDTLRKGKNVGNAHQVFDKMKRRFKLDIKSYTILLKGWGQEKNNQELMKVWREMKDGGFEPDVVAYGTMINAHCKSRKYDDAVKVFNEMPVRVSACCTSQ